jgi:hypothetical protein
VFVLSLRSLFHVLQSSTLTITAINVSVDWKEGGAQRAAVLTVELKYCTAYYWLTC